MLTAIVVGGVGVLALNSAGLANAHIKATNLLGVVLGAGIFGVGMVTLGYCPGTAIAAAAKGVPQVVVYVDLEKYLTGQALEERGAGISLNRRSLTKPQLIDAIRRLLGLRSFAAGAHVVTVDVDPKTGLVEIVRYVAAEDVGTVINPAVVEGQVLPEPEATAPGKAVPAPEGAPAATAPGEAAPGESFPIARPRTTAT